MSIKSDAHGKMVSIEFLDICEAERVARIVEMWNPSNPDLVGWRDDVVSRMYEQTDKFFKGDNT